MKWQTRVTLAIFSAVLAFAGPAPAALDSPIPAFATVVGPQAARGVVIWSHGRNPDHEEKDARTPPYLEAFRAAGWDVYRFDRLRADDNLTASSAALAAAANHYRQNGYRRVVVAGQSFGGFLSLIAMGQTDAIDQAVVTAPAAFGPRQNGQYQRNATELYPILQTIRHGRVMIFYFDGDDFDPGGRADPSRRILADNNVRATVIDRPAEFLGHGSAESGRFARRFAACILRTAETGAIESPSRCDSGWGGEPTPAFAQAITGVQPVASKTNPLAGAWYGTYANGREVALIVSGFDAAGGVSALYAVGPDLEHPTKGVERSLRNGRVDQRNGQMIFDEQSANILSYRLSSASTLTGEWRDRNTGHTLETVLHRLPPRR